MKYLTELLNNPDIETLLIGLICLFIALAFLLFLAIMVYRSIKIADLKYIAALQEQYDELFMNAAFAEPGELNESIEKAKQMNRRHLKNKRHSRVIGNQLLQLYSTFSGESKDNLREIYTKAGFLENSRRKIASYKWELAAQGIKELAIIKKAENIIPSVKKLMRSRNKVIVENVQLSLVKIKGFGGLDFLDETVEPISDWQQINLVEALKEYANTSLPDFSKWLSSKEESVILFAVRLIRYFKKIENSERLYPLLTHGNKQIKKEAIQALSEFGDTDILNILLKSYNTETPDIQIQIIKAYTQLVSAPDIRILTDWLKQAEHMEIRRTCLEAIISMGAMESFKKEAMNDDLLYKKAEPFLGTLFK